MADMVKAGTWVRIRRTILEAGQRTGKLPEETKKVSFEMWNKGYLLADAAMGDSVTVRTRIGREEQGVLTEVNPQYQLNYGDFVPELLSIGDDARSLLEGGSDA